MYIIIFMNINYFDSRAICPSHLSFMGSILDDTHCPNKAVM